MRKFIEFKCEHCGAIYMANDWTKADDATYVTKCPVCRHKIIFKGGTQKDERDS